MITVLVVDDHRMILEGMSGVLGSIPNVQALPGASNGLEVLERLNNGPLPDVTLMDISMPVINGLETTNLLLAQHPSLRIAGFSMFCDYGTVVELLRVGAVGYLMKTTAKAQLIEAFETIVRGQSYYSGGMAEMLAANGEIIKEEVAKSRFTLLEHSVMDNIKKGVPQSDLQDTMSLPTPIIERLIGSLLVKTGTRSIEEFVRIP